MAEQTSDEESETIAQVPCSHDPVRALAGVHETIRFEGALHPCENRVAGRRGLTDAFGRRRSDLAA